MLKRLAVPLTALLLWQHRPAARPAGDLQGAAAAVAALAGAVEAAAGAAEAAAAAAHGRAWA